MAWLAAAAILLRAATPAAPAASAYHYVIRAEGSEIHWDLPATLHTVHGTAPRVSGTIDVERVRASPRQAVKNGARATGSRPASASGSHGDHVPGTWRGKIRIAADAAAMDTGNSSRDRKMREKSLKTSRYPLILFESHRVEADLSRFRPGEHLTVEVSGDLIVRGRPAPIRLPVDVFVYADHVLLSGGFSVGWKQFGVPDPSFGIITVREPVRVTFRLRAAPRGNS